MTELIKTVNLRPQVIAALEQYHKADATLFYWREKLKVMEQSKAIVDDLTEEEKKRLTEIRIRTLNHLERAAA